MISRQDLETLFSKQLSRINSEDLKNKVIEVWLLGCKRGGWDSVDQLKKIPFTMLTDCKGINFIEHTIAVTESAVGLAEAQISTYKTLPYKIDMDRLVAGGLLHDVGKLLEIQRDSSDGYSKSHQGKCARHPISGAILAAEVGVEDELVNIIACHSKEGDGRPQVIETILIHQADFATFNPLVKLSKDQLIV